MAMNNNKGTVVKEKVYATDEAGMLADAKSYAKKDFNIVRDTISKLVKDGVDISDEANIAEALIQIKLSQIKDSRLNRPSYFD